MCVHSCQRRPFCGVGCLPQCCVRMLIVTNRPRRCPNVDSHRSRKPHHFLDTLHKCCCSCEPKKDCVCTSELPSVTKPASSCCWPCPRVFTARSFFYLTCPGDGTINSRSCYQVKQCFRLLSHCPCQILQPFHRFSASCVRPRLRLHNASLPCRLNPFVLIPVGR